MVGLLSIPTKLSVLPMLSNAAAGGLIRDADGRCLAAFTTNLDNYSITRAEMRGAILGLQLAWENDHKKVLLQINSLAAMRFIYYRMRKNRLTYMPWKCTSFVNCWEETGRCLLPTLTEKETMLRISWLELDMAIPWAIIQS
ncbi:hypothetical protein LINPERHAP1_LOCUS21812 [Linum perenne]